MNKDEENKDNFSSLDPVSSEMNELDQFLCYMKLRDELFTKFSSLGVKSLKNMVSVDENTLTKILTSLSEIQGKMLIRNLSLLSETLDNSESFNISEMAFDLGGVSLSKETIITGFKMKNKAQSHTLSYQQNLEKNSKPVNNVIILLQRKNLKTI